MFQEIGRRKKGVEEKSLEIEEGRKKKRKASRWLYLYVSSAWSQVGTHVIIQLRSIFVVYVCGSWYVVRCTFRTLRTY